MKRKLFKLQNIIPKIFRNILFKFFRIRKNEKNKWKLSIFNNIMILDI